MKKSDVLAFIGARGGSKGIPKKNLSMVAGFPLISYSMAAARLAKGVDRIIVSTDSEEIAEVSKKFGADVPFLRPKEISGDDSLDIDFFKHALAWLKANENYSPNYIMHLRPTVPAREPRKLEQAIAEIIDNPETSSLRSAHAVTPSAFKLFTLKDGPYCHFFGSEFFGQDEEFFNYPRQKLPPTYHVDGYVDIIDAQKFLSSGFMYGKKMKAFIIDDNRDIDDLEDIPAAEAFLREERFKPLFDYLNKVTQ